MAVRILVGDCRETLKALPDASVDSCVCDPPYHLLSTVKRFGNSPRTESTMPKSEPHARMSRGFMGQTWDGGDVAFQAETWAEVLRVLKPGAHLVAFSGTRTYHRMAVAIEDAGFEIRDQLAWVYGTGFPKSKDLGDGWGTALKPSWEPIALARRPLEGTNAANMAKHGVGGLNIAGCRIVAPEGSVVRLEHDETGCKRGYEGGLKGGRRAEPQTQGRWPANLCHDGSDEVVAQFPAEAGAAAPVYRRQADKFRNTFGAFKGNIDEAGSTFQGDRGSAARFFYCGKATAAERGKENTHPTVKPVALMRWLCRLITPVGGVVLDPFMGSGSTGIACDAEQFDFIGCELSPEYAAIAEQRIRAAAGMFADVVAA